MVQIYARCSAFRILHNTARIDENTALFKHAVGELLHMPWRIRPNAFYNMSRRSGRFRVDTLQDGLAFAHDFFSDANAVQVRHAIDTFSDDLAAPAYSPSQRAQGYLVYRFLNWRQVHGMNIDEAEEFVARFDSVQWNSWMEKQSVRPHSRHFYVEVFATLSKLSTDRRPLATQQLRSTVFFNIKDGNFRSEMRLRIGSRCELLADIFSAE